MSKSKQQKKKDRERRVAKEKLADAARRRADEKAKSDADKPVSRRGKILRGAVPEIEPPPGAPNESARQRLRG